ncbi:hypothetical protein SAMN05444344_1049 [Tenacibaculum mesophilum]|uniref:Uncharacterized protein n=1 Tax=Tenacibaculum mesophilum TaxID=104268 RepID=A0AAE9MPJ6_9FLAO|nr:DUF6370 family protein [Tenacibaculum mesophilum]AZJ33167.1 hypothetical protein D6200_11620 [Tenacibaculum mesophilum]KAF9659407.1 hypothetical protein HBA12_03950 [Tenacibaculum mesophilum]QFS28416.1 hypothetical protein F9Y86_08445 [Tenacibaculum mesophilum]UTD15873.1 hypothetical protein HER15_10505 [Tenacibaculum mesophilum]SHF66149.1 hypothetical protein SAMN05444344_1049 [Tenacibaculum mesophilum]
MKKLLILVFLGIASCSTSKEKTQIAEASCGQCKFGLDSQHGCDLAVKIDGQAYFIDGAHIDDYGDAHDKNIGFCNVVRKAEVIGKIENNRFKASSFKIVEE